MSLQQSTIKKNSNGDYDLTAIGTLTQNTNNIKIATANKYLSGNIVIPVTKTSAISVVGGEVIIPKGFSNGSNYTLDIYEPPADILAADATGLYETDIIDFTYSPSSSDNRVVWRTPRFYQYECSNEKATETLYASIYFPAGTGGNYKFEVQEDCSGNTYSEVHMDTGGALWDSNKNKLLDNDDSSSYGNKQPSLRYTCSENTLYYFTLSHYSKRTIWNPFVDKDPAIAHQNYQYYFKGAIYTLYITPTTEYGC